MHSLHNIRADIIVSSFIIGLSIILSILFIIHSFSRYSVEKNKLTKQQSTPTSGLGWAVPTMLSPFTHIF